MTSFVTALWVALGRKNHFNRFEMNSQADALILECIDNTVMLAIERRSLRNVPTDLYEDYSLTR